MKLILIQKKLQKKLQKIFIQAEYKNNELNYSVTTETENNISIENINSINIIAEKNSINEKPHNFRPPPAADKKPIKNI